jgi:hypothetical protein
MPVTVGDMLVAARELCGDPCLSLGIPVTPTAAVQTGTSPFAATQTVYMVITFWTAWGGESAPSAEVSISATTAQQAYCSNIYIPPGTTKVRTYFGIAAGGENQYVDLLNPTINGTVSGPALTASNGIAGKPPVRNRAYLPDTDGGFISATTAYRWLNEALTRISQRCGGIEDFTGVQSQNAQGNYQFPGFWRSVDHAYYDGWIMDLGNKGNVYRRNKIATSVSGMLTISKSAEVQIFELFPQPNRTGGATTLAANIGATDTTITLTDASSFVLPMGTAQIGPEIIYYSTLAGNTLSGCIRGISGTTAIAQSSGAAVTELNIQIYGRRIFTPYTYSVGSAASTLPIPPGWEGWIPQYLLTKFKQGEGEYQVAGGMMQSLDKELTELARANRQIAGPRQIGSSPMVGEVYGGTIGGGWLIP